MVQLKFGSQSVDLSLPAVEADKAVKVEVEAGGHAVASREVTLKPVRKMQIFLLPHSHNDIGYTELQAEVEKKQNSNIETGLRLAKATADYPEGSRFKWNVEVLWCVDNYLRAATPEKRAAFMAAVKSGQVGLDAFYCNILAGLCRPEELLNLMRYATQLSAECGVPIESAMISDVPGYTWGTVSAMAQAGVKYFSFAPNYFDRMGGTMKEWQNKPFWWKGPDGRQPRALLVPHHAATRWAMSSAMARRWRGSSRITWSNWRPTAIPTTSRTCAGTSTATTARPTRRSPMWCATGTPATSGRA